MKKTVIAMLALAIGFMAASCKPEEVLRPTSVSVSPSSVSLVEGETTILSVSVQPAEAQSSGISWSSSDTKVATVSNGTVTAVSAGKATISASADGIIGTSTVTVTAKIITVTGITLDKTELELTEGDEAQLNATVAPDDATDKSITWKSSDDKVATVSSDGKVTAVAPGEATITVTTTDGGNAATCKVTVLLPEGALPGVFSVSDSKQIQFSKGNLVATIDASGTPTAWKFAANQYDCLGEGGANQTIGTAAGDIDLFGWSTDAASNNWGIHTKTSATDGFTSGYFKDWGTAIDSKGTWRTLTKDEWRYLFDNHVKVWGQCNSVNGYFIAPDGYGGDKTALTSDVADWASAEAEGIVFLPAAGWRDGSNVYNVGSDGLYWSSSALGSDGAFCVFFASRSASPDYYGNHSDGLGVRLITDVK